MAAVFAEYVLAAVGGASWDLRWGRVISRQANLAAVAAPFVIALFLVRVRHAWWWLIALVPLAMVVLLSQQRALFLAFPIGIVVALAFALRCRRVRKRSIVLLVAGAAVMLSAAWFATGSLTTSGQGGPSVASGVSDRVDETRDGASAPALVIRLISFAWIWENRIVEKPILGWGIGDVATVPILRGNSSKMMRVDNSFVTLWWKSGVIGLALFVGLWTTLFVSAWRLTRHPHPHVQVLAIGVGGTVAALFVLALAASLITHYRFNALWGILMGVVAVAERVYGPREVSHG
jgi:O-antigen ligase